MKKKKKKKRKEKEVPCTYQDTVVLKKLAWDELIAVIVLVRWEKFTKTFSVDVRECIQVEGKTWRGFQTGKRTNTVAFNKISSNACDVQV